MKMHASRHVPDFIAKKIKRVALLVFWFFGAWASPAFGDPSTALVTLNCKDESLKKVLLAIQDQTKYNFSFGEEIESIDGISIRVKAQPLSEVLQALSGQARVSFVLEGSMIVVKKSKTKSAALPSANPMPESRAPIKVSGTVTDSSTGDPIPGVNVTVKGTTQGVSTDAEGKYVLVIENPEAVLVFSFVSYVTQETSLGNRSVIDIQLLVDQKQLEEVVVLGYGTQKKELLTGAVGSVKMDQTKRNIPMLSAGNLLAGQIAGVDVSTPRGLPNSNPAISIRQTTSWNPQDILYVIDGRIANGDDFNKLAPNEIEEITVLKDAASTAVYGSRAAAGVILVTTRRGDSGRVKIEYSFQTGVDSRGKNTELQSAVQQMELENWGTPNRYPQSVIDKFKNIDGGWGYDQLASVWRTPSTATHNLNISGGTQKVKYFLGGSYTKQNSFLPNVNWQNYNIRTNVTADIAKGLSFAALLSLNSNVRKYPSRGDSYDDLYGKLRVWQPYQPTWTTDGHPLDIGWWKGNVGALLRGDSGYDNFYTVKPVINLQATYQIPSVDGLSLQARYGASFSNQREKGFVKTYDLWTTTTTDTYLISTDPKDFVSSKKATLTNSLFERYEWSTDYQLNLQINYERIFRNKHHVKGWLIYELYGAQGNWMSGLRERFPVYVSDQWRFTGNDRADSEVNGSTLQPTGRKSYIGQFFYDYQSKYLASFAFRYDGSMKFAPRERWGFFPSGSLGWILSKENFFKTKKIDLLKVRASAGLVGNDGVGGWQWQESYTQGDDAFFGSSPVRNSSVKYEALTNPNLTWEKTFNFNAGADIDFLKNFNASFNFFFCKTYDILGPRETSVPPSFSRALPKINYGEIRSHGFELTLGYSGQVRNLTYHINANAARSNARNIVKDKKVKFPYEIENGKITNRVVTSVADKILRTQADLDAWNAAHPAYTYQGYKAEVGQLVYKDISGPDGSPDGKVDDWDQTEVRKDNNAVIVGLNFGAAIKGFSLDFGFNGQLDYLQSINAVAQNVDWNRNWVKWSTDSWRPENPNASLPKRYAHSDGTKRTYTDQSTFWYKNSGWLRCRYISLAYSLPQETVKKAELSSVRLFVNLTNPFIISQFNKLYYDPEIGDPNNYPVMRTFTFGVSLSY